MQPVIYNVLLKILLNWKHVYKKLLTMSATIRSV